MDFYVYVLFRENGVPFYVGKGRGKRWFRHEETARGSKRRDGNRHKLAVIRKMHVAGLDVPKVKVATSLTDDQACAYEVAWIAAIGRADLGSGPLANMTNGDRSF